MNLVHPTISAKSVALPTVIQLPFIPNNIQLSTKSFNTPFSFDKRLSDKVHNEHFHVRVDLVAGGLRNCAVLEQLQQGLQHFLC